MDENRIYTDVFSVFSINESMNELNLKNNEVHQKLLQNDRQDMKRIEKNYYINDVMKIMLKEQ